MKIQYSLLGGLAILAATLLVLSSHASAENTVPSVAQLESQFESQLTTREETYGRPKATSYYDDKEDHYEQEQLMFDQIDEGIR